MEQNDKTPAPSAKILGVAGSPRKNGNSDTLLRQILKGVQSEKVTTETVQLRNVMFQPCVGCEKCRKDRICTNITDGMTNIYPNLLDSKGLVLVSPTHNYNITAWMKAFIDRLYCFYEFTDDRPRKHSSILDNQGRMAGIAAVCEQTDKKDMGFTLEAMRMPLEALGYEIAFELPVFGIFDRGKVKKYDDIMKQAKNYGSQLGKAIIHS